MDAVTAQLDAMTSHVSGMQAQQEEAKRRRAYPQDNGGVSARERRKLKKKEAAQAEADAEAEAAALLARARRLVDAAKGIELPDFSTLFNRNGADASGAQATPPRSTHRSTKASPIAPGRTARGTPRTGRSRAKGSARRGARTSPIRVAPASANGGSSPLRSGADDGSDSDASSGFGMDFEARSAAMQASMAMMQREATIAAATAKIPHHREGGIDMTKVRPEAKAAPESAEDRARRLQKDARKRVARRQRKEAEERRKQQEAEEAMRHRAEDDSGLVAKSRAAAARRARDRKRKEAERKAHEEARAAAKAKARATEDLKKVEEFRELTLQRVEERAAAKQMKRRVERERRHEEQLVAAAKRAKLEAERDRITAREQQLAEETQARLAATQAKEERAKRRDEEFLAQRLRDFKLEKERIRQEMERMKQAAEKDDALWQAKEALESAMDGGVAADWAVAPVTKIKKVTATDSAAKPVRFAAGGTNGMGYSTVMPDALPSPLLDDLGVDSVGFDGDTDDSNPLWVGTVSRAADGHHSALSNYTPPPLPEPQHHSHQMLVYADRTAKPARAPSGLRHELPPLPASAGVRRSAPAHRAGAPGSTPSSAPSASSGPLSANNTLNEPIDLGDMPPEASDMYDDLVADKRDLDEYSMQQSTRLVKQVSAAVPRQSGGGVMGLPSVDRLRRQGSRHTDAGSVGSGGSARTGGSHRSSKRRPHRRAVWRQTPIPLAPAESFYSTATSKSRYSAPASQAHSVASSARSMRHTRSVGGNSRTSYSTMMSDRTHGSGSHAGVARRAVRRSAAPHRTLAGSSVRGAGGGGERAAGGGLLLQHRTGSFRRMQRADRTTIAASTRSRAAEVERASLAAQQSMHSQSRRGMANPLAGGERGFAGSTRSNNYVS